MNDFNKRCALIVIDVQNGFDHPSWGKRNNPGAEQQIAKLLTAWRSNGLPIYHVQHASTSSEGFFQEGRHSFEHKELARPLPSEPIYKKSVNSAFIGTNLEQDLRLAGIDTTVVVGLTTNHCVSTTARMSGNLGFKTYVIADATATFDNVAWGGAFRSAEEVHLSALSDLNHEFAEIVNTEEVLQKMPGC